MDERISKPEIIESDRIDEVEVSPELFQKLAARLRLNRTRGKILVVCTPQGPRNCFDHAVRDAKLVAEFRREYLGEWVPPPECTCDCHSDQYLGYVQGQSGWCVVCRDFHRRDRQ